MRTDLESELLGYILDVYERCVMAGRSGRVSRDLYIRRAGRRVLVPNGGFLASSAAYLALTPFEGNPYFGREDLLALALDAGDRLVLDHADVGRKYERPNHFTIYPLAYLYELAGDHAGRARRLRWRETLARNLAAIDALIDRTWPNLGRPGPYSGTGPNHFFGWFAVGHEQALVLEDEAMARKIERAMLRHMRIQSAGGYFPEHVGPAVAYHHVSLGGLAEFHRQRPRAVTLRAIQRGVAFLVRALYPDLRGIETFDERNRLGKHRYFQPALCWTSEGRTLLERQVAGHREQVAKCPPTPESLQRRDGWALGAAFRCFRHALATRDLHLPHRPLPVDRQRFTWRLEDKGLVRKAGPWFYALSAWAHPTLPGNPYHLERTQALSVYHEKVGLVIGGGNDKRAHHAATIHILEGGEVHYFPPLAGKLCVAARPQVLSGSGRCDRLEFDYGSAYGRLEVRVESPRRLRIALAVSTTMSDPEISIVLQLPLEAPVTLRAGRRRLALRRARGDDSARIYPVGRTLALPGRWKISLPAGASLLWPHIPWNGYRPPEYRDFPENAVALLRIPLRRANGRAEVTLHVPGRS